MQREVSEQIILKKFQHLECRMCFNEKNGLLFIQMFRALFVKGKKTKIVQ